MKEVLLKPLSVKYEF